MKRLFIGLSLVIGVWMLSPTPEAQAWSWGGEHITRRVAVTTLGGTIIAGAGSSIPELDPSAAGSAMVLLLGRCGVHCIPSARRRPRLVLEARRAIFHS